MLPPGVQNLSTWSKKQKRRNVNKIGGGGGGGPDGVSNINSAYFKQVKKNIL